jgi:hypothetical protein
MKKTLAIFCALVLVTVASSFAGISVDHDKNVDFSKFKSFVITEANPPENPLMRERLINAIVEDLEGKGLTRVEEGFDLEVVVHASSETEQRISESNWGYGGYRGWYGWGGWGTTTVNVTNIEVGTLLLDIVASDQNKLVWRGIATDSIPKKSAKLEKKINKAVAQLFRHFPPDD